MAAFREGGNAEALHSVISDVQKELVGAPPWVERERDAARKD